MDGHGRSVTIVPITNDVTVSWQIRSVGSVHLRLYREQPSGPEVLIKEVIADQGMSNYSFVDAERPPGSAFYMLRVLNGEGKETTLASALCVEPSFAPANGAVTGSSFQPACMSETVGLPRFASALGIEGCALAGRGTIPAPEPPVPRKV